MRANHHQRLNTTATALLAATLALTVNPAALHAQATSPQPNPSQSPRPAKETAAGVEDESITLSPFTIEANKNDIGYFASNTLAGSRLNSSVGDLASSITVVTKQQLEDTNSHNLNDVLLYEANTEGARNYTPIEVNRNGLKDNIGGSATNGIGAATATTATRLRGLAVADTAWNYYTSIRRIRADSYNVSSVEISRGPNSLLFGLGSPAGIVNFSLGYARTDKDSNEVNLGFGSNSTHRESIAVNKVLIPNKLAIYAAALYNDDEFARKPSYDISRRQTGGITFKPTKKTTIKAFVEGYTSNSRTPNDITPQDGITPWLNAGRPVWDPLTRQVTWLNTGKTSTPYTLTQTATSSDGRKLTGDAVLTDTRSPLFVSGLGFTDYTRTVQAINPDGSYSWFQRQASVFNIYGLTQAQVQANAATNDIFERRYTNSTLTPVPYTFPTAGTYIAPAVSNRALYDWQKVNLTAANHGSTRNATYNVEFEQQILPDLFFSAGWFRQDLDTLENYSIGQQSTTSLLIDTNVNLPSGQKNPNYLRPYVQDVQADTAQTPEVNETYRTMLAYDKDFSKNAGWTRWLGRHRILGFASRQENTSSFVRARFSFIDPSDPRFLVPTTALGLQTARPAGYSFPASGGLIRRYFYVGGADGVASTASATTFSNPALNTIRTGQVTAYNYTTGQWEQANATTASAWFDAGNGIGRSQKVVGSFNTAMQSFFLNDRIVTTIGFRRDRWAGRNNTTGADAAGDPALTAADLYPNGLLVNTDKLYTRWDKMQYLAGNTKTLGVVAKPLSWLSLHFNKSDNFNPPAAAASDIFGNALPKPTGRGKDYGFSVNILENKLIARVNFFEDKSTYERAGTAGTLLGRLTRQDTTNFRNWAESIVRIQAGEDPSAQNFATASDTTVLTQTQKDQIAKMTSLPTFTWPDFAVASTQTNKAKGAEFELIYNPEINWNIKLTVGKQESSYDAILPEYDAWVSQRMAIWKAGVAPAGIAAEYTKFNGEPLRLGSFWSGTGFGETSATVSTANGVNPEDWFNRVVVGEVANARQLQGAAPFGQRKYRGNILSNYEFIHGPLKNLGIGGAIRWEDKAVLGYFGLQTLDSTVGSATFGQMVYTRPDPHHPIYDTDRGVDPLRKNSHLDLWVSYKFKLWNDKVRTKIQLNVSDLTEEGGIRPVYINLDGSVAAYRIVDSRTFMLNAKFDF